MGLFTYSFIKFNYKTKIPAMGTSTSRPRGLGMLSAVSMIATYAAAGAVPTDKPNFVILFADDWGFVSLITPCITRTNPCSVLAAGAIWERTINPLPG